MSIYLLTSLVRSRHVDAIRSLVLDGRVRDATSTGQALLEAGRRRPDEDACAEIATLCADLMLAQDRDEEAEELYRVAVRAGIRAGRGQVRVMSCRSTGITSLYRQRLGTAADCFRRL